MLRQHLRARHRRLWPDAAVGTGETPPSLVARARLEDALRHRADAYRADATVDLTLVEALLRMDELEAAAHTLDEHRALLAAMAHDLQVVVADAAVEREAERVCNTSVEGLEFAAPPRNGLRRRLLTATGAAAVVLALLLPTSRISPRTTLASLDERMASGDIAGARERLDAARSTAAAVRAQAESFTARTAARNQVVRNTVRALLAAGTLPRTTPDAEEPPSGITVLSEVRAAREALQDNRPPQGDTGHRGPAPVIPLRVGDTAALADQAAATAETVEPATDAAAEPSEAAGAERP